jgi:hypothetical protein
LTRKKEGEERYHAIMTTADIHKPHHETAEERDLDEILREEEVTASAGCGILGRYPLISVISFAALGLAVGIGLSFWQTEDDSKEKVIKWIGLVGELFIRALKCVILPLVFINVSPGIKTSSPCCPWLLKLL